MRCQIKWICAEQHQAGNEPEAVALAVVTITYSSGDVSVHRFGCCAKHAAMLDDLVAQSPMYADYRGRRLYTSQWTREPMPMPMPAEDLTVRS